MRKPAVSTPGPRDRFSRKPVGGLLLTDRDEELIADVFLHRAMTRGQVEKLYFGSVARCNRRLRQLFDHGYLARHYPATALYGAQAVYVAGTAAVAVLVRRTGMEAGEVARLVRRSPTPLSLAHTLESVNAFLRFRRAADEDGDVRIDRFVPELPCRHEYEIREAGRGRWRREVFRPDGFVRLLHAPSGRYADCFLEIDLGHVSSRKFTDKMRGYARYRESGLFAEMYGGTAFLVLVVTTGARRLSHLRELAERGGHPLFRFTTAAALEGPGPLAAVWERPAGGPPAKILGEPPCSA